MIYELKKLDELFLSDPYNHAVFSTLGDIEVYIVGGYLRDVMLGKRVMDRDYIVRGDLIK